VRVPRHLKHPVALWIGDERKRLELKPADVGRAVGVGEGTVRVWEAARADAKRLPSPANIEALETLFGSAAPGRAAAETVLDQILVLVRSQAREIKELRRELGEVRLEAELRGAAAADVLAEIRDALPIQLAAGGSATGTAAQHQGDQT